MKPRNTKMFFILDESGSMTSLRENTLKGFNSMIRRQKSLKGDCQASLIFFSSTIRPAFRNIPLRKVRPLGWKDYCPDGCTALYDAVGSELSRQITLQSKFKNESKDKVIFVIMTDGMENASREYTGREVRSLIEHAKTMFGWEFIFLGANLDAAKAAEEIGISKDYAAEYVADPTGTDLTYESMSEALMCMREDISPSRPLEAIRQDSRKRSRR